MYAHICTDQFLTMSAALGLVEFDLNISTDGVDFGCSFDTLGHLFTLNGSAETNVGMIEHVFEGLREKLLGIADFGALEPDATAAVLHNVALLDEVLHGPSTGRQPGAQATDLDNL